MSNHSNITKFKNEVIDDLKSNILPFWLELIDSEYGGFYGQIDYEGKLDKFAPKGGIYISRILWTFSRAYRIFKDEDYLKAATVAFEYLNDQLWDQEFGGVFWSVEASGEILDDKKMFYVQAFSLYGFSEYYRASGKENALSRSKELFNLIEKYGYDTVNKGYYEGASRDWMTIEPMVLGENEPPTHKSMNTHLHILEAYSNFLLCYDDQNLKNKQKEMVNVMLDHIVDSNTSHFNLYFDNEWNSQNDHISYGHDIEGSWLLEEAARILGDESLIKKVEEVAIKMGEAVYKRGIDENSIIHWEGNLNEVFDSKKYWWSLAEQVVGFYNMFQMTKEDKYLDVTIKTWGYIKSYIIDSENGEWIWGRFEDGKPILKDKVGIWKGPYHNGRMGFEILERIS